MNHRATIAQWRELDRWIPPSRLALLSQVSDGWPLTRLGDNGLIRQVKDRVKVEADVEYRMLGVRWYGEGTFHRETVLGKDLSATYVTPAIPGSFMYNRLFAWKGSFAVVPDNQRDHYVSSEFPQFTVDQSRLSVHYLYLFFMCSPVTDAVNAASIGSAAVSRNRFKEQEFLNFRINLPPLEVQNRIVSEWETAQHELHELKKSTDASEAATTVLLNNLGLQRPKISQIPKTFAVAWSDFARWSVSYNKAILGAMDLAKGKHSVVALGSILTLVQYGTSEKANKLQTGTPVIRMNNISDGELNLTDLKHVLLPQSDIDSLKLIDGDILFNRTNSKELVGKCAVYHPTTAGECYVFASYLIRIRLDTQIADPDFVSYIVNSVIGRNQINAMSRQIIGQANINSQELRSLQIPMPPLDQQLGIVRQLNAIRRDAAISRSKSDQIKREIKAKLEALILGGGKIEEF